jgi:hypothetical protein
MARLPVPVRVEVHPAVLNRELSWTPLRSLPHSWPPVPGQFQTAVAGKMLAMSVDAGRSAAKLIDAATQNIASLANLSAGIGTSVNTTA